MSRPARDLIGAAAFIAVGVAGLATLGELPFGSASLPGPAMLPSVLSALIIVLAAVHMVRALRGRTTAAAVIAPEAGSDVAAPRAALLRVAGAVAIIGAWVLAARPLGFLAATALAMSALYALGGGRLARAVLAGVVLTVTTWVLFGVLLDVPLPRSSLLD